MLDLKTSGGIVGGVAVLGGGGGYWKGCGIRRAAILRRAAVLGRGQLYFKNPLSALCCCCSCFDMFTRAKDKHTIMWDCYLTAALK